MNNPPLPNRVDSAKDIRIRLPPSELTKDRNLSFPEKLAKVATQRRKSTILKVHTNDIVSSKPFTVPMDSPIFEAFPSEIHLQNYEPFQTYEVVVTFRNIDRVICLFCSKKYARFIKVKQLESSVFSITSLKSVTLQSGRLATGMEVQFVLRFTPTEPIDYFDEIHCITERETFILPINAIGNRGIIDINDEIKFNSCPVNFKTTKTLLLRNIGNAPAKFTLSTNLPMTITPSSGFLNVKESMQIDLVFCPEKISVFNGELCLIYDTGEEVFTNVSAYAHAIDVYLEKSDIQFENQFIGKNLSQKVRIVNHSSFMVNFEWKMFNSVELEIAHREKLIKKLKANHEADSQVRDPSLAAHKLDSEISIVNSSFFPPESKIYFIEPVNGVIWPHSVSEATIMFQPTHAGKIEELFHLSVSGLECRIPLQLKGFGLGPRIKLSKNNMNFGEVFIGTEHSVCFTIENKGQILAPIRFMEEKCSPNLEIVFDPPSGSILPNKIFNITATFKPKILGQIEEDVFFQVEGAPEEVYFTVRCNSKGPSFELDRQEFDFGNVSVGFPIESCLQIKNTSPIPFEFKIQVESENPSIFRFKPSGGNVSSNSSRVIKLICTPKTFQDVKGTLLLNIGTQIVQRIPISGTATTPRISVSSTSIEFGNCYLTIPYHKKINIVNKNDLSGTLLVVVNEEKINNNFSVVATMPSNIIEPNGLLVVDLKVTSNQLGDYEFPVSISILNAPDKCIIMTVKLKGIGPDISISHSEMRLGKIPVLEDYNGKITITNTSLIIAKLGLSFINNHGTFMIDSTKMTLSPHSQKVKPILSVLFKELSFRAFLTDAFKFTDILKISVENGKTHQIPFSANGFGNNLVFSEPLKSVTFESVITGQIHQRKFIVTNKSRRNQSIYFKSSVEKDQVFTISPERFTLKHEGQQELVVQAFSKLPRTVSESLFCFASLEQDPNRKLVVESCLSASFVAPVIQLSQNRMEFFYIQGDPLKTVMQQELFVTNKTGLSIEFYYVCGAPFEVISNDIVNDSRQSGIEEGKRISLPFKVDETIQLTIRFNPPSRKERTCSSYKASLVFYLNDQIECVSLSLQAETIFPSLSIPTEIIFPSTTPNIRKSETITLVNDGLLPVSMEWMIERTKSEFIYENSDDKQIDPTLFNIIPRYSIILPGESLDAQIIFCSSRKGTFKSSFICKIKDGPFYRLKSTIVCSNLSYTISTNLFEIGQICFDEIIERTLTIRNTGQICMPISILKNEMDEFIDQKLSITCHQNTIQPGEYIILYIKYCPCFLGNFEEVFFINIEHMAPEKIVLKVESIYPRHFIDLPPLNPRNVGFELPDDEYWKLNQTISEMLSKLQDDGKSVIVNKKKDGYSSRIVRNTIKEESVSFLEANRDYLGSYVCNMGYLFQSQIKKKSFYVKNIGTVPISLSSVRGAFEERGISVEYEQNQKIAGGETMKIGVTLKVPKIILEDSVQKSELVLCFSHGIKVLIVVLSQLCVPTISIASKDIDFGEVFVGQSKTASILFTNNSPVSCDWKFVGTPVNKQSIKKVFVEQPKEIVIITTSGQLSPGQSMNVEISLTPKTSAPIRYVSTIRVINSIRNVELPIYGVGVLPKLLVETPTINFGHVVPFSEPIERNIFIKNPSPYTLELFALEHDEHSTNTSVAELQIEEDPVVPEPTIEVYIVHGPPFSGKSTLSLYLCDEYPLHYMNIDELILYGMEKPGPLKERIVEEMVKIKSGERFDDIIIEQDKQDTKQDKQEVDIEHDFDQQLLIQILTQQITSISTTSFQPIKGFVFDGLSSQFVKSQFNCLKGIVQSFDSRSKFRFLHISADIETIHKRETDSLMNEPNNRLDKYSKDLEDLEPVTDSTNDIYDLIFFLNKKLKTNMFGGNRETEKHLWRQTLKAIEDKKSLKSGNLKGGKPSAAPARKSGSPKLRVSISLDESDNEDNLVQLCDNFEEEHTFREYEKYVNTLDMIFTFIKEGCKEDIKDKKNNKMKTSLDSTQNELDVEIDFTINEINSIEGSELFLEEAYNLLDIGKDSGQRQQDQQPPYTFCLHYQKYPQDFKPISKNFKIIACGLVNEENNLISNTLSSMSVLTSALSAIPPPSNTLPVRASGRMSIYSDISSRKESVMIDTSHLIKPEQLSIFKPGEPWTINPNERIFVTVKFTPLTSVTIEEFIPLGVRNIREACNIKALAKTTSPTFNTDPQVIFSKIRKSRENDDTISGEYIIDSATFDFGCLLANKTKDQKTSDRHKTTLDFLNNGDISIRMNLSFKNDFRGDVFTIDSPTFIIEPGQHHSVIIWALPKQFNIPFEDTLICLVMDNPEPVLFHFTCLGCKLEMELDKKQMNFEKLVVGLVEKREIIMKNPTTIPLTWKISSEGVGDELLLSPMEGVLLGKEKVVLIGQFKSSKPVNFKKLLKLELAELDKPNILLPEIPIQVTAEVFELQVDILLNKGLDVLDFGILRLNESQKQTITLKNKGKFDFGYRFSYSSEDMAKCIEFTPPSGSLIFNEKSTIITVGFSSDCERSFNTETLAFIEFYELNKESIIQKIPIKFSVQVIKSSHKFSPSKILDFGKCVFGVKASKHITIENNGPNELKYIISKFESADRLKKKHGSARMSTAVILEKVVKKEQTMKVEPQSFGPFGIALPSGIIGPNSKVTINVDFNPECDGSFIENVLVDCVDKDVENYFLENAIEYTFAAESQTPAYIKDISHIFKSIEIIRNIAYWSGSYPVFSVQDNTLFLGSVLLGNTSTVPIVLSNPKDVNCDLNISIRSRNKNEEAPFQITPKTVVLGSKETLGATISFQTAELDNYTAYIVMEVESVKKDEPFKFDIKANSIVPHLKIVSGGIETYPTVPYIVKFLKTSKNQISKTLIKIKNHSALPAVLEIKSSEEESSFFTEDNNKIIQPNMISDIWFSFKPIESRLFNEQYTMCFNENLFEVVTLKFEADSNTSGIFVYVGDSEITELNFGNCNVGIPKPIYITIRNDYEKDHRISFVCPIEITISPISLILSPNESKEIQLSFLSDRVQKEYRSNLKLISQDAELVDPEKEINLIINSKADYIAYECSNTTIEFEDVCIHETKYEIVTIKNVGILPIELETRFFNDEGVPIDSHEVYDVSPSIAEILPGTTTNFKFSFSPKHVNSYTNYSVIFMLSYSKPDDLPLCIKLNGNSKPKPYHIHFTTEFGQSFETFPNFKANIITFTNEETSKRVIEFNNLKNSNIEYTIIPQSDDTSITFNSLSGIFVPGPNELPFIIKNNLDRKSSVKELKYTLKFNKMSEILTIKYETRELSVSIDKYILNFKHIRTGKGVSKKVTIINKENFSIPYTIEIQKELGQKISYYQLDSLNGIIPPNSSIQKTITFKPDFDRAYDSSLKSFFINGSKSLGQSLFLKGEGYDLLEKIVLCQGGIDRILMSGIKAKENYDLGRLILGEEKNAHVIVENNGRYTIDFSWSITGLNVDVFKISPVIGSVKPGETALCEMKFVSLVPMKNRTFIATCVIDREKKYILTANATVTRSNLDISETEIDFGSLFLGSLRDVSKPLKIVNKEKREITITAHTELSVFPCSFREATLQDGESLQLITYFKPIDIKDYNDVLILTVNHHSQYRIPLKGSGVTFDLSILDIHDNVVDFGSIKSGQTHSRKLRLKNNSPLSIPIQIANKEIITKLLQMGCKIAPERVTIKSREIVPIHFTFSPKGRLGEINEKIDIVTEGSYCIKTLILAGSCHGIEFRLSESSIYLGPTLPNIAVSKVVILENVGEIGSNFAWDTSKFNGLFSLEPREGFISPKASVSLKFTFKSRTCLSDVKTESIICQIDGTRHLTLQLCGSCPKNPLLTDTINFSTNVRQKEMKSVSIANPTSSIWKLQPSISGMSYSGLAELIIEPNQTKSYQITYAPMEMTIEKSHEGFLNIPLPISNLSKLFKLIGTSQPPLPTQTLTKDLNTRREFTDTISVSNWLNKTQKFQVSLESITNDPMITLKGEKTIDVGVGETINYPFTLFSLKEGTYPIKIVFTNSNTGEYIWFSISYRSLPPDNIVKTITSHVRQKVQKEIKLKNPFDYPITINFSCNCSEISIPSSICVPSKGMSLLTVDYFPLQVGETTSKIVVTSQEFGTTVYELKLIAKPAKPEKPYEFTCFYGSTQTQIIKFTNYSKTKCEYSIKIDHGDFSSEKTISSIASSMHSEICFDVVYEPCIVGTCKTLLTITSPQYGDYEFALIGNCLAPEPIGPLVVKMVGPFNLTFRNVGQSAGTFTYLIDNPNFTVKGVDTIPARKSIVLAINFKGNVAYSKTGKMIITNTITNSSWIYYLKGVL